MTSTIPIVFLSAADPIKAGLVAGPNRPGGNFTGISFLGTALKAKRLEILQKLVPSAALIGVPVDPTYPDAEAQQRELQDAGDVLKQPIAVVGASTPAEINQAFATLSQKSAGAVLVTQAMSRKIRRCRGRGFSFARRQHVRHRYSRNARC